MDSIGSNIRKWLLIPATGFAIPIALIAAWEIAVRSGWFPPSFSAAPSSIAVTCVKLLSSGVLAKHALLSILRIVVGVALGATVGIALGVVVGQSKLAERLLSPMLQFIAPVPVIVWIPFAIMLFGIGELYKISLAMFATSLLVYVQTFQGVRGVPQGYLELASMYEKTRWQKISRILLPSALPAIATGIRIALAISWIAIYIVEYSSAQKGWGGLGWFIADAREVGRVEHQFAGVLILGLIGFLSDAAVAKWQARQTSWAATLGSVLSQEKDL